MFLWCARRWSRGFAVAALICLLAVPVVAGPTAPTHAAPGRQPGEKLLLAFYYMWYGPNDFDPNRMIDRPANPYISDHADVIARQVGEAKNAGIDAFISSWTGTGTETDANFPKLLSAASAANFKATVYFETNFAMQHGSVVSQLQSMVSRFANQPAFLRANAKPVIFFWKPDAFGGPAAWQAVRQQIDPNHSQIWSVDTTDKAYLDVFDSIHLFSAGKWNANTNVGAVDQQWRGIVNDFNSRTGSGRLWAAGVIPGWDESRVQPPRPSPKVFPRRDGAMYEESWQAAIASDPDWITITSFNEWFEGTQIEPSATYANRYLDLTRKYATQWKGTPPPQPAPGPAACTAGQFFAQTAHSICSQMQGYWQQYGGLIQFGYPITDPLVEVNPTDGKSYTVQYFERARFELHPENAGTPYQVLLGLVGRQFHAVDGAVAPRPGTGHYFEQTGHNVSTGFYQYWQQHGGLFVNGYPISEEFPERSSDGKTYTVQYFERARFEWHPENQAPYNVLLGFLGHQAWSLRSR